MDEDHPRVAAIAGLGREMFGDDWQGRMARLLAVNRRSLERWMAGTADMPIGVFYEVVKLRHAREAAAGQVQRILGDGYRVTIERQET